MKLLYIFWNFWDCIMVLCNWRFFCFNFVLSLLSGWWVFFMLFWMFVIVLGFCILFLISCWFVFFIMYRCIKYFFILLCRVLVFLICFLIFFGFEFIGLRVLIVLIVFGSYCFIFVSDELNCNVFLSVFFSFFCLLLSLVGKFLNLLLVFISCFFIFRVDGVLFLVCCKSCWLDWFSCFIFFFFLFRVDIRVFICFSFCWILLVLVFVGLWEVKVFFVWVKVFCIGCKVFWYFLKVFLVFLILIFFFSIVVCNVF